MRPTTSSARTANCDMTLDKDFKITNKKKEG
jgi:hypothetical protein